METDINKNSLKYSPLIYINYVIDPNIDSVFVNVLTSKLEIPINVNFV